MITPRKLANEIVPHKITDAQILQSNTGKMKIEGSIRLTTGYSPMQLLIVLEFLNFYN